MIKQINLILILFLNINIFADKILKEKVVDFKEQLDLGAASKFGFEINKYSNLRAKLISWDKVIKDINNHFRDLKLNFKSLSDTLDLDNYINSQLKNLKITFENSDYRVKAALEDFLKTSKFKIKEIENYLNSIKFESNIDAYEFNKQKETIKYILNIYKKVLLKTDQEYKAKLQNLTQNITKKELLDKIDKTAENAFFHENINLTLGHFAVNTSQGPKNGLTNSAIDSWTQVLKDVERFVIASGSQDLPKLVNPKEEVSIWTINKKIIKLIDDVEEDINTQNPKPKYHKIDFSEDNWHKKSLENADMDYKHSNLSNLKKMAIGGSALSLFENESKPIYKLINKLDEATSIIFMRKARIDARDVIDHLNSKFTKILDRLKYDIEIIFDNFNGKAGSGRVINL